MPLNSTMEGYDVPAVTQDDASEAANVFLSVTSDVALYRGSVGNMMDAVQLGSDARIIRRKCLEIANGKADELERLELCNGPISYLSRAIAAGWIEDYYRDAVRDGE